MSDLDEMWAALERYQPYADKNGHGESWKRMTTEKTAEAAWGAANADATDVTTIAAWEANSAARDAAMAKDYETDAVRRINKAMKEVQP